ncbi:MAG: hypothetical protein KatS3mg031_2850 [Chitinophagales bacterium]|nr:MAG: hypothetical protein KatS3mg031_2850 [Chitinophagales bacterium]
MKRIEITISFAYFNRPEMYKGAALFVEDTPKIFVPFNRHELKNIIATLYEVAEERGIKVEKDREGHVAYLSGSSLNIQEVAALFEEVKRRYTPKPRYYVAAVDKKGSYYLSIVESGQRLIKRGADGPSLSQEQFFSLPLGKKFRVSRNAVGYLLPGTYFSYEEALKAQAQIYNEIQDRHIEVGYQVVAIEKNGYTFLNIMKRIAGTLVKTSRRSERIPYELFKSLPLGAAYSLENLSTGYPLPGVYSTIEEAEESFNKIIKS